MKQRLLPALLFVFASSAVSTGERIEIRHVRELVERADLIARVRVLSVFETGAKPGDYGKVSLVSVTEAVRGAERGDVFELEHSAVNVVCPNVRYEFGEDVLLFAVKSPNGRYATLYADAGKFLIRNGRVDKPPFTKGQSYRSAVAEVRRELEKLRSASR
jgi:predicted RNA-binding protein with TRAM domain